MPESGRATHLDEQAVQVKANQLRSLARDCFQARLLAALRVAYPRLTAGISDADFTPSFDSLAQQARAYGLVSEHAVASFIHAAWLFGEGFDTRIPAISQILGDTTLPAPVKARALADFSVSAFRLLASRGDVVPA